MAVQQTFDQVLHDNPDLDPIADPAAIAPNIVISARIVFEPMPAQGNVRVTARTDDFRLLWGVTASPSMLARHPAEVAFYEALIEKTKQLLPPAVEAAQIDSITLGLQFLQQIRSRLDEIEKSLSPKKVTDKTMKRAAAFLFSLRDAVRLLNTTRADDES